MKSKQLNFNFLVITCSLLLVASSFAGLRGSSGDETNSVPGQRTNSSSSSSSNSPEVTPDANSAAPSTSDQADELAKAKEAMRSMEGKTTDQESSKSENSKTDKDKKGGKSKYYYRHAEAFVAGSDWEFDGFVAGGQDQEVKSMFAINDLLYFNIGSGQGVNTGDRFGVYRRGERIRDPQSGKVIGFEVRKVAVSEVTDRVDAQTCSSRIVKSFESVEIGDLVRREE